MTIYSGVKIDNTIYEYSDESSLEIDGVYYSLRQEAIYDEYGDLQKIICYRPEDNLEYTRQDLLEDPELIDHWGFPIHQECTYENGELFLNKEHGKVEKIDDTFFKLEKKNYTVIYKTK